MNVGAIILAAGSSRRFGDDKRKLTLDSGRTVLEETIHHTAQAVANVLVVLRYGDAQFGRELDSKLDNPNIQVFCAPDSALGMAHSLSNAIHIVQGKGWDAAMIVLADMPYSDPQTLKDLLAAIEETDMEHPIVLPANQGRQGHPVIFSSRYYDEIRAMTGDRGARALIDEHPANVVEVSVSDDGIFRDIDLPEDVA